MVQRIVHPLSIFAADNPNTFAKKTLVALALFQQRLRTSHVGWLLVRYFGNDSTSLSNQAVSIFVREPKSSKNACRDGRSTTINLLCSSTDGFGISWHS